MRNPELFAYLGLFSGFMVSLWDETFVFEEKEHLALLRNHPNEFEKEFKVFFRSIGERDDLLDPYFTPEDLFCKNYGIDQLNNYHRRVYENQYHDWGAFRRGFYDFAQLVFK